MSKGRVDSGGRNLFDEGGKAVSVKDGQNMIWECIKSETQGEFGGFSR